MIRSLCALQTVAGPPCEPQGRPGAGAPRPEASNKRVYDSRRPIMLGDIVELTVVVRDIEAAIERFTGLFGLTVHHRGESKEFGFKNAILPTGIGHIELLQPTDPDKAVGRFLAKHGEGVYLVGFECQDIPGSVERLKKAGARVDGRRPDVAWVHPQDTHGLFVELRKRESYA
jgi:methylmalonyl-CoA/ethylmalonyl-CoA epimerase